MRTSRLTAALVVLTLGSIALATAHAANWPRFRGPNGSGEASDKHIPITWNEKEGILWKAALPGVGNSSPVVWGDRLFIQTDTDRSSKRLLLCVDVHDGKVLWSRGISGAAAHTHPENTRASSTPCTDGERVYALFWDGNEVSLHAYDFHGTQAWTAALGSFTSQHGPGTSPVVFEDKVFLANDQDGASMLYAFEAKTGKVAWQAPRKPFRACYSTPFVLERPGQPGELVVASTAGVTAYNPHTGNVIWNWTWDWTGARAPLRTVASPIYHDGLIFVNSGDGGGDRTTIAIRPGGKGELGKDHLVWRVNRNYPYVPGMVARGEHLYFTNDKGFACCALARTGELVYNERLAKETRASALLIDGKVYCVSDNGTVYVLPAEPTFKVLAKTALGEPVIATPAVADNRLYIRGKNHLFCIGQAGDRSVSRH